MDTFKYKLEKSAKQIAKQLKNYPFTGYKVHQIEGYWIIDIYISQSFGNIKDAIDALEPRTKTKWETPHPVPGCGNSNEHIIRFELKLNLESI